MFTMMNTQLLLVSYSMTCSVLIAASGASAHLASHQADRTDRERVVDGERRTLVSDARGALGQFDEAGDIPGCLLGMSFGLSFSGAAEQHDLVMEATPDGGMIQNLPLATRVNNLGAIASAGFEGPAGGPDPGNDHGFMLQMGRDGVGSPGSAVELLEFFHNRYAPADGRPLFIEFDVYKHDHATFAWWRPVSYAEGLFTGSVTMGGLYDGGLFAPLAAARGDANANESLIFLASNPSGAVGSGAFFLGAKDLPENGWLTIGLLLTTDSMSIWVRDRETFGDGSLDVRTPVRDSGPLAGTRMFSEMGFGLEQGWAQVYPGTQDDAATADIVEGFGSALYDNAGTITAAPFAIDANGNVVGAVWAGAMIEASRFYAGGDPDPALDPGYVPRNWWIDNYCVRGGRRVNACPGDITGDGVVGAHDLAFLLASWGNIGGLAEIDGSSGVNAGDLAVMLSGWGSCE